MHKKSYRQEPELINASRSLLFVSVSVWLSYKKISGVIVMSKSSYQKIDK